jgi:nitrite reductase/ring-hydroxylating ferredoxin subunit
MQEPFGAEEWGQQLLRLQQELSTSSAARVCMHSSTAVLRAILHAGSHLSCALHGSAVAPNAEAVAADISSAVNTALQQCVHAAMQSRRSQQESGQGSQCACHAAYAAVRSTQHGLLLLHAMWVVAWLAALGSC